ncbi:esterase-like activity of phytase family protein [Skermanella rosea]|uniref:esterase-like activity of phytase family protein n=1 Tax=Skermanella rosea TaxID=1817965 RepID=UPI001E41E52C|nr:esterase-like activity of phytase family protein [Skermanella rosea]UEM05090.1 esterase-like activity of phytase family protein [Skermanella rosea]
MMQGQGTQIAATPIVIGHRGASGSRPEHTLEAYRLAIELGADFIEPDLVTTRDGVLIARHENLLAQVRLDADGNILFGADGRPVVTQRTTDVAEFDGDGDGRPDFADRFAIKLMDGEAVAGWFSEDFSLAEIKQLGARERIPAIRPDNAAYDGRFEIPTLEEIVRLVKQVEAETGRKVGIYAETKHPTYHALEGTRQNEDRDGDGILDPGEDANRNGQLDVIDGGSSIRADLGGTLVRTLAEQDFTDPSRVFIQSFEVANLIELQDKTMPAAGIDLPLVQLLGSLRGSGGFSAPYDIAFNADPDNAARGADMSVYDGFPIAIGRQTGYGDLVAPDVLKHISARYAEGIGPWIDSILLRERLDRPVDADGDGAARVVSRLTGEIRPLIRDAHEAGLLVHPYTLRAEENFLPLEPDGTALTLPEQVRLLAELGADGFFTDHPGIAARVLRDGTEIEFLGVATLPAGFRFEGTEVGGLSGLAWNPATGSFHAISDSRGGETGAPRFHTLDLDLSDGRLADGDVAVTAAVNLTTPDGRPFPDGAADPEGIALSAGGTLFIASEGDAGNRVPPFVAEFGPDGRQLRSLEVPSKFLPDGEGAQGVRNNLAFESLTLTPDGRTLYSATENALAQDGPEASLDRGSPVRILAFDTASGRVKAEYLYPTEAIAAAPKTAGGFALSGLVELLALDDQGTLLALERSFGTGAEHAIKLFEMRIGDADDISGIHGLAGRPAPVPAAKELLLDLSKLGLPLGNVEGLALGPVLPDGRQSLVLVSDNNFSRTQTTRFLGFALDLPGGAEPLGAGSPE